MNRKQAQPGREKPFARQAFPSGEISKENSIARTASTRKTQNRYLARKLRKTSRVASLGADISASVERFSEVNTIISNAFQSADESLKELSSGVQEIKQLMSDISSFPLQTHGGSFDLVSSLERASKETSVFLKTLLMFSDSLHGSEKIASKTRLKSAEFKDSVSKLENLSGRVQHISEWVDVAGINASLEAGRAGKAGEAFGIVAAGVQKASAFFLKAADDFFSVTGEMKTTSGAVSLRIEEISNKTSTLISAAKGIQSGVEELKGILEGLSEKSVELSASIGSIRADFADSGNIPDTVSVETERYTEDISNAFGFLEQMEISFTDAAAKAVKLAEYSEKIVTAPSTSMIDEIFTGADELEDSVNTTSGLLEEFRLSLSDTHLRMEKFEHLAGLLGENLNIFGERIDSAASLTSEIGKAVAGLKTLTTSLTEALQGMKSEISTIEEDQTGLSGELDSLQLFIVRLLRFDSACADFAAKMEFFATTGKIEELRSGEGSGFKSIPQEFEAIAGESNETRQELAMEIDALRMKTDSLFRSPIVDNNFRRIVDGLILNLDSIAEEEAKSASEATGFMGRIVSGHGKRLTEGHKTISKCEASRSELTHSLGGADALSDEQGKALVRILELATKLCEQAEELEYGEDWK